jgi:hypothetical protein
MPEMGCISAETNVEYIIYTEDGGDTWISTPTLYSPFCIQMLSKDFGYAAGQDGQIINDTLDYAFGVNGKLFNLCSNEAHSHHSVRNW